MLQKVTTANANANESKCLLNVHQLNFLGHQRDNTGIKPDETNVGA